MEKAKPQIEEIIWDADNTLWNWVRYAGRAYRIAADIIIQETRLPESVIIEGMKTFYTSVGTLEDAGLIQALEKQGLFRSVKNYDRQQLIKKVKRNFDRIRTRYLQKYAGIDQLLYKTHQLGIRNVIVTDAPSFHAKMRLIRSKLHEHIDVMYAIKGRDVPDLPPEIQEKERQGKYKVPFEIVEIELEKPHTPIEQVVKTRKHIKKDLVDYLRDHVAIIGDNDKKDMQLARKHGCLGLHAMWGKAVQRDLKFLAKIAPASITAKNVAIDPQSENEETGNIVKVYRPSDIEKILGI